MKKLIESLMKNPREALVKTMSLESLANHGGISYNTCLPAFPTPPKGKKRSLALTATRRESEPWPWKIVGGGVECVVGTIFPTRSALLGLRRGAEAGGKGGTLRLERGSVGRGEQ